MTRVTSHADELSTSFQDKVSANAPRFLEFLGIRFHRDSYIYGRDRAGKLEINLLNWSSAQAENSNAAKFDRFLI